ncbi:MAG: response regulator transcription factor [Actinomycetota bacterium]
MPTRVYLLDDHELVREGLRAVLEREGDIDVVGESGSALAGIHGIEATRPDVALIDLRLPDGDGVDLCRAVRNRVPGTACLILTSYSNDEVLLSAIRADAAGFLLKRTPGTELIRSVRVVAAGGSLIDAAMTGHLLERLRSGPPIVDGETALRGLSPQERRLLDHLGEGLTNRQVAERMELAEKTVKNYVSNLLRKLNMSSRTEAAVFVTQLRAEQTRRDEQAGSARSW